MHCCSVQRTQFPLRPAFAMTAHKVQGATLTTVGLHFGALPIMHGQAYVMLSRVRDPYRMKVFVVHCYYLKCALTFADFRSAQHAQQRCRTRHSEHCPSVCIDASSTSTQSSVEKCATTMTATLMRSLHAVGVITCANKWSDCLII